MKYTNLDSNINDYIGASDDEYLQVQFFSEQNFMWVLTVAIRYISFIVTAATNIIFFQVTFK